MEAVTQGSADSLQVVWSAALVQGLGTGFAFVFRPGRVLGAKKFTQETWVSTVSAIADPKERAKALKTVDSIEAGKRFEFTPEQIQAIEFTAPSRFGSGKIVFRAASGEETVKVSGSLGTGSAGLFDALFQRFSTFAPGKVRRVG